MSDHPTYPPANYPKQETPDTYSTTVFAPSFEQRREAFWQHILHNPAPEHNSKRAYYEVARAAAGGTPHEGIIHETLTEFIEARADCADFALHAIIRMLYQIPEHFSQELREHAKTAILGFKYWPDEPGRDDMCTWTENHQILFATAAYLVGQMYPDEVFSNTGHTGRQKIELSRPRILRWLDLRFKTGFSEWLSNVYYDKDLAALLNLLDFAADEELRQRAKMIVDLLLFDMALNSFKGVFGSTHGRSYEEYKKWARLEGTTDIAKLLFGTGVFSGYDNMSVVLFAMSENYRLPQVIFDIANTPATFENRQRMGIKVSEAKRWGLKFDNLEDGMVLLSLEAYLHPHTANLTMRMFDEFNWWENAFFKDFANHKRLIDTIRRFDLLPWLARLLERDVCRNTREEVNIYTYRTSDYMLSSALHYRPGYGGDQQHIWQATLGPDAVCFTTHPPRRDGPTPNYWTGSGTLPRVVQHKNVLIAIYNLSRAPGLYVTNQLFFTHAWLPRDQFDEVIERKGWIFAHKDTSYLALHSRRPYTWQQAAGEDNNREIIAEGQQNIWICELGSQQENGNFSTFVKTICAAPLSFNGLRVSYQSPAQGRLEFGWKGPYLLNKEEIRTHEFPRYDNLYTQVDFPAQVVEIKKDANWSRLDWERDNRKASAFID
ncbi:MAG: hypothetical protein JXB38_16435 [Anaerolineales bacterium]|nr:hypothetical protein [Anaerolineales bacterium]